MVEVVTVKAKKKEGDGEDGEKKMTKKKFSTSLEKLFVAEMYNEPDRARIHLLDRCNVLLDVCTVLNKWANVEGTYGQALDKIIVSANRLNSLKGASGMVNAIAAVVGSFQSLGKHHIGLQQCIQSQVHSILSPLQKDQKKQVQDLAANQLALQKDALSMASVLTKAKERFAESKRPEDSIAVQQASVGHEKQIILQKNGLRNFLSNLWGIWVHRADILAESIDSIVTVNRDTLEFNDEVVTALHSIISSIDIDSELCLDVASILKIDSETIREELETRPLGSATNRPPSVSNASFDEVKEDKLEPIQLPGSPSKFSKLESTGQQKRNEAIGSFLAGKVYDKLGTVEPDAASSSVDAVVNICNNAITIGQVAQGISIELAGAFDQRGKDVDGLASKLQLQFLRVSCEYSDVFSEDQIKESERQAWRIFMVIMKQSSMVLADVSEKMSLCGTKFSQLVNMNDRAKQQVVDARNAAQKELQLVASHLKDVQGRLQSSEDAVQKAEMQAEKAESDLTELRNKRDRANQKVTSRTGSSSVSSTAAASNSLADDSIAATANSGVDSPKSSPAVSIKKSLDGQDATDVEVVRDRSISSSGNVVQRFFGLSSQSMADQISEAEEKLGRMKLSHSIAIEQRDALKGELQSASKRLESQIKAYAVQIAGTVSGFVSAHASRVKELKVTLEQLVSGAQDFIITIQQLQNKLMLELSNMDTFKDISEFIQHSKKLPPPAEKPMLAVPISFKPSEELENDNDGDSEDGALSDSLPLATKLARRRSSAPKGELHGFSLPADETVIATFSCAYLPGKVPQQGRLICTKQFLCFTTLAIYEPMLGSCKVAVPFNQVSKVTKAASAWGLVANSLVVHLKPAGVGQEPYDLYFTSLFYRDRCFETIASLSSTNKEKEVPATGASSPWRFLDPRLGDDYTGNSLVITLKDSAPTTEKKKKRSSGFMRLGLSHRDFDTDTAAQSSTTTEEAKEGGVPAQQEEHGNPDDSKEGVPTPAEETESEAQTSEGKLNPESPAITSEPYSLPCKMCNAAPSSKPCKCWSSRRRSALSLHAGHSLLLEEDFRGNLQQLTSLLFLGLDPENGSGHVSDLAKILGERLGDYDQNFPAFKECSKPEDWAFHRNSFAKVKSISEGKQSDNDKVLARVVSFSHPIGNTPFGKQVANTTQLQRVWGCSLSSESPKVVVISPNEFSVELCCDTSLSGFPYSDSFVVRSTYLLSELENQNKMHPAEAWCRLVSSCRVVWLKSVSVPFLKGKIEKENVQTGKKNMEAWVQVAKEMLAKTISRDSQYISASQPEETSKESFQDSGVRGHDVVEQIEVGTAITRMDQTAPFQIAELWQPEFYMRCWQESSNPQKLHTLLLSVVILLQLLNLFLK